MKKIMMYLVCLTALCGASFSAYAYVIQAGSFSGAEPSSLLLLFLGVLSLIVFRNRFRS
jgi:hypothetical protein